jgi:hypothetical protein
VLAALVHGPFKLRTSSVYKLSVNVEGLPRSARLSRASRCEGCRCDLVTLRQFADQCEQRQVHRNDDGTDSHTEETD